MRKFKEIVSYFNYENTETDIHSVMVYSKEKLMLGTVVRLDDDDKIVPSDSSTFNVYGVVIENDDPELHCVAVCGTVMCICQSNNFIIGDYVKSCSIYGAGSKHVDTKNFELPKTYLEKVCFGKVVENKDLRTAYLGYVKIKLSGKSCITCSTKST